MTPSGLYARLCHAFLVYNMNVSIFNAFGWKTPIHACKIGVLGQFDPLNGVQYQRKPKKAHPCVSSSHLSHQASKCGERSDLKVSCLEGSINKKKFGYISPICPEVPCPEAPHGRISTTVELVDVKNFSDELRHVDSVSGRK